MGFDERLNMNLRVTRSERDRLGELNRTDKQKEIMSAHWEV